MSNPNILVENKSNFSSKRLALVLVIITLIVAFLSYFVFTEITKPPAPSQTATSTSPSPSSTQSYPNKQMVQLPIALTDPAVNSVGTIYTLSGSIYSLTQTPKKDEWQLVFRGAGNNIYFDLPMTLGLTTPISSATSSAKLSPAKLHVDDLVSVTFYYDNIQNRGSLTSVKVLPKPKLAK